MDVKATEPLWAALASEGVDYALVGGLAMYVHGLPRFTEDIDIFVKLDEQNVERLKRALKVVFADPDIDGIEVFERPIGSTVVKVVTPASLHWMKASTVRPIDAQDAERLRQAFDL